MITIKVLDDLLINKIAAGEVVERPSSVVKELVENSIDALSDEIKIELKDSGISLIKITDNGKGMNKEDAMSCLTRHATSKIYQEEDLYNLNTLGFRGEALPSIASVSNLELDTSDGIEIGTIIKVNGGIIDSISSGSLRKGTIISVNNLFYNTPARLKHMKSLYTELANIVEFVNKIALSRPDIKITLINDDKIIFSTDGSNNLLKVIRDIYGMEITKSMIAIEGLSADYKINGYVSSPFVHRSNRSAMILFVNGRVVRNNEVNNAIKEAYRTYQPDNRYPVTVINVEVDPSIIDVNIHPNKMDVKFSKIEELLILINNTIYQSLIKEDLVKEVYITNNDNKIDNLKEQMTLDLSRTIHEDEVVYESSTNKEKEEVNKEITKINILKELYPVGLVKGTYLIAQNEEGMYVIDIHAAKERINYEIVLKDISNPNKQKTNMLIPLVLEFSNHDYLILKNNLYLLENMNFEIEEFGINSLKISAHPTWINNMKKEVNIKSIIEIIIKLENNFKLEKFLDNIAANQACKMSIKANTSITMEEMENLINDLRKCDNPFNCPHGRPSIIKYTFADLEKLFNRSGFE